MNWLIPLLIGAALTFIAVYFYRPSDKIETVVPAQSHHDNFVDNLIDYRYTYTYPRTYWYNYNAWNPFGSPYVRRGRPYRHHRRRRGGRGDRD
jgi:hypothetical protein